MAVLEQKQINVVVKYLSVATGSAHIARDIINKYINEQKIDAQVAKAICDFFGVKQLSDVPSSAAFKDFTPSVYATDAANKAAAEKRANAVKGLINFSAVVIEKEAEGGNPIDYVVLSQEEIEVLNQTNAKVEDYIQSFNKLITEYKQAIKAESKADVVDIEKVTNLKDKLKIANRVRTSAQKLALKIEVTAGMRYTTEALYEKMFNDNLLARLGSSLGQYFTEEAKTINDEQIGGAEVNDLIKRINANARAKKDDAIKDPKPVKPETEKEEVKPVEEPKVVTTKKDEDILDAIHKLTEVVRNNKAGITIAGDNYGFVNTGVVNSGYINIGAAAAKQDKRVVAESVEESDPIVTVEPKNPVDENSPVSQIVPDDSDDDDTEEAPVHTPDQKDPVAQTPVQEEVKIEEEGDLFEEEEDNKKKEETEPKPELTPEPTKPSKPTKKPIVRADEEVEMPEMEDGQTYETTYYGPFKRIRNWFKRHGALVADLTFLGIVGAIYVMAPQIAQVVGVYKTVLLNPFTAGAAFLVGAGVLWGVKKLLFGKKDKINRLRAKVMMKERYVNKKLCKMRILNEKSKALEAEINASYKNSSSRRLAKLFKQQKVVNEKLLSVAKLVDFELENVKSKRHRTTDNSVKNKLDAAGNIVGKGKNILLRKWTSMKQETEKLNTVINKYGTKKYGKQALDGNLKDEILKYQVLRSEIIDNQQKAIKNAEEKLKDSSFREHKQYITDKKNMALHIKNDIVDMDNDIIHKAGDVVLTDAKDYLDFNKSNTKVHIGKDGKVIVSKKNGKNPKVFGK